MVVSTISGCQPLAICASCYFNRTGIESGVQPIPYTVTCEVDTAGVVHSVRRRIDARTVAKITVWKRNTACG